MDLEISELALFCTSLHEPNTLKQYLDLPLPEPKTQN